MIEKDMLIKGKGVKTDDMEEFYTIEEIAHTLKMSKGSIYRFVKRGALSAIKVGGKGKGGTLRFRQRDLDTFSRKFTYKPAVGAVG